jgi:hypothetical protein
MYGLSPVNVNALEIRKVSLLLRGSRPRLPDFHLGLVRHLPPDRDILLDETSEGRSSIVQIFLPGLANALLRFGAGQPMLAPILGRT